jgi:hypothetical protein
VLVLAAVTVGQAALVMVFLLRRVLRAVIR